MQAPTPKTPKEDGDDKLFVETVHELTKENASKWVMQASMGQRNNVMSIDDNIDINQDDGFVIKLSKQVVKEKGEQIKEILKKYPGDKQVYLSVEGTKIRTNFKVDDCSDLDNELGGLGV